MIPYGRQDISSADVEAVVACVEKRIYAWLRPMPV